MAPVHRKYHLSAALIAVASLVGACTGGDSAVSVSGGSFSIGGTVSGLAGTVVLQLNGGESLSISADGPFVFSQPVPDGSVYDVTVATQPAGEICTVGSGFGTVAGANVTNVSVVCSATTFTVGGTVSGLAGTVVLQVNGADNLSISANGPFTFPQALADGGEYKVTVLTQPAGQTCSVGDSSGIIAGANVTDVDVVCSVSLFSVGGTVSGLAGTVTLQLNGAESLNVSASGPFVFKGGLPNGGAYAVSVLRQPAGQTCAVGSGSGTIAGANVTNVTVFCSATLYSIGGTVSGLAGTVALRLNGSTDLSVSANGPFVFPGGLPTGSAYSVTVLRQPPGEICAVGNGSGTVAGANVTSVSVVCSAATFTVGGSVSGLAGTVVLQLNGGANLSISANGPFVFSQRVPDGGAYSVTVLRQPAGQSCSVANASGTIAGANVSNVAVACSALPFSVGGTMSGLAGTVVLQLNGGSNLSVSANGPFTFAKTLADGAAYVVTVLTQPAGQMCVVGNAAGTVEGANVVTPVVCSATTFTVGGAVSGLVGTVVLQLNADQTLSVSANGPFTFPQPLPTGGAYAVSVLTQPAGEVCTVANGTGTVGRTNVTSVSVVCSASLFTVGGTVSGLAGSVILQLNGGQPLSVSANGPFTFPGPLPDGGAYAVTVLRQPAGEACGVANGSGTLAGANVTNVSVVCSATTFTVGGTVSGLITGTVVLQLNGVGALNVSANGPFTFPGSLPTGSAYTVRVLTQPAGQDCSVGNGSGTIGFASVTDITVACRVTNFTVGGTVSGVAGTVVLRLNVTDNLSISANGPFTFAKTLLDGAPYVVTVLTQPAGQTCTVANGHGKVSGANVTNVAVVCSATTFTVGGTLSGLSGTIVLENDEDVLTLTADGPFTFAQPEAQGAPYSVEVQTPPAGQRCSVANGAGTIAGANVTNVVVTCVNQLVFFAADDGVSGVELWKSDGTAAGTALVKDIFAGPRGSQPHGFVAFNGAMYFAASDGVSGFELWKTDGTGPGTTMVKDINAGPGDSNPSGMTVFNGALYFSASDGVSGTELWKTDGTTTVRVKDINPGRDDSHPEGFTEFDGLLYFSADDGSNGTELWKTDGTNAGTVLVKDIDSGTGDSNPGGFTVFDGELYFSADDGRSGVELWKTDGTAAGTVLAKEINPRSGGSNPTGLTVFNGSLFFAANDGATGIELWKTDGTDTGTVLVKDIRSGKNSSRPTGFKVFNGSLFFTATDGASGFELWKSDGTAGGTVPIHIDAGSGSSIPTGFTEMNGALFFSADNGTSGNELWKTDGTDAGTVLVKDIKPGAGNSNPGEFAILNGTLFFSADDGATGTELWKSDGSAAGTLLVKDIDPVPADSNPAGLTPF